MTNMTADSEKAGKWFSTCELAYFTRLQEEHNELLIKHSLAEIMIEELRFRLWSDIGSTADTANPLSPTSLLNKFEGEDYTRAKILLDGDPAAEMNQLRSLLEEKVLDAARFEIELVKLRQEANAAMVEVEQLRSKTDSHKNEPHFNKEYVDLALGNAIRDRDDALEALKMEKSKSDTLREELKRFREITIGSANTLKQECDVSGNNVVGSPGFQSKFDYTDKKNIDDSLRSVEDYDDSNLALARRKHAGSQVEELKGAYEDSSLKLEQARAALTSEMNARCHAEEISEKLQLHCQRLNGRLKEEEGRLSQVEAAMERRDCRVDAAFGKVEAAFLARLETVESRLKGETKEVVRLRSRLRWFQECGISMEDRQAYEQKIAELELRLVQQSQGTRPSISTFKSQTLGMSPKSAASRELFPVGLSSPILESPPFTTKENFTDYSLSKETSVKETTFKSRDLNVYDVRVNRINENNGDNVNVESIMNDASPNRSVKEYSTKHVNPTAIRHSGSRISSPIDQSNSLSLPTMTAGELDLSSRSEEELYQMAGMEIPAYRRRSLLKPAQ